MKARWQNEKEAIDAINEAKARLEEADREAERAERDADLERAAKLRYGEIPELEKIVAEREARLAELHADGGSMLAEEVTEEDVAQVVAKWTGIPVSRLMEGEVEKLIHMEERLHERVIGQDEAIGRSPTRCGDRRNFSSSKPDLARLASLHPVLIGGFGDTNCTSRFSSKLMKFADRDRHLVSGVDLECRPGLRRLFQRTARLRPEGQGGSRLSPRAAKRFRSRSPCPFPEGEGQQDASEALDRGRKVAGSNPVAPTRPSLLPRSVRLGCSGSAAGHRRGAYE